MIISASILSANFANLAEDLKAIEKAGVDWIHIDVMDGHFVPNITMGPAVMKACKKVSNLPLDVHLMIEKPERHLEAFAEAGASLITVHIETCPHIYRTLQSIHELGCKAGVVLNPGTPASSISEVLPLVDMVLVMMVNPGFSGQIFLPGMLPKIHQIREMLDSIQSPAWLEVDGGISPTTLPLAHQAGATAFVAATAIFTDPAGAYAGARKLRTSVPD